MCRECWIDNGSHAIVNDRTKKCAELIQDIYDSPDGGAGGYAHIVVDDWNLEDEMIKGCLDSAITNEYKHIGEQTQQACITCLEFMLTLTEAERYSAMAIKQGLI